jgi:hypothetical protein
MEESGRPVRGYLLQALKEIGVDTLGGWRFG